MYRTNSHYIRPARGAFLNQNSLAQRKASEISYFKAKATMKAHRSVNLTAVYSAAGARTNDPGLKKMAT
jgi:hypothetical protein